MAIKIILEEEGKKQVEIALDPSQYEDNEWEKVCHEIGNKVSRELGVRWLESIEERLFHEHPKGLRVEGFRERERATPFGRFTIRRRLYRDKQSSYHFLLDEHLDCVSYRRATPGMTQSLAHSCTRASFREVSREYSACGLSNTGCSFK